MGIQKRNLEVNRSLITLTASFSVVLEGEALPLNVASLITYARHVNDWAPRLVGDPFIDQKNFSRPE